MSEPALTRLFDDKTWRLSRTSCRLMLSAFVLFAAVLCGERTWPTFHPAIANDGTTLSYAQFARNLIRYPLSETSGLMAELVGNPPDSPIAGERRTFYSDHPPGLVWLIALFDRLTGDAVVAARLVSTLATIGTGLAILAFVLRRVSPLPATAAAVVLLTLPLYWEHAVVGNFEPVTLFFTVLAAIAFVGYLRAPSFGRLAATAAFWVLGMLCDWPAYLLGGPIAAALLYRRRWGLLLLFTALGAGTMAAVFAHLVAGTGMSVLGFFHGMFHHEAPMPFLTALRHTFDALVQRFSQWVWLLLLPLAAIVRRGAPAPETNELRFLFLSFLFIGVVNDVVFNQWAATHPFWSYYLIPAACFGMAVLAQSFHDWRFRSAKRAHSFRAGAMALFVIGAALGIVQTAYFIISHFHKPPTVREMLAERQLAGLLDRSSVILVGPYCRRSRSPTGAVIRWPDDMPSCDIFTGHGYTAQYFIDKPAIPATDLGPSNLACENAFVVLKGPDVPRRLAGLSITPIPVPWFDWYVLPLSQLAPAYCDRPAQLFLDMSRATGI